MSTTDPIKQTAQITKAYAEDRDGLTQGECKAAEGKITADERKELEEVGYKKEFIQSLAGVDDNKAWQSRVRWLGDRINRKTFFSMCWNNCDENERYRSIQELGVIGSAAASAIPTLITALKEDESWRVRDGAADTLSKIGCAAVPALIATLKDEDSTVRINAVWALGVIGDSRSIPPLKKMIRDDSDVFCRRIAQDVFEHLMEKYR